MSKADITDAIKLVRKTFEAPFERGRFIVFVRELLNTLDEEKAHKWKTVKEYFSEYIASWERIGVYRDANEKRIDILIVHLKKETSLERARTMQRNFVAGYLRGDYGSTSQKDAALVAFVSAKPEDWRFSLVKMEYVLEENEKGGLKGVEKFTPARRWSFLVGANEKSHTAQTQLVPLIAEDEKNPTLEDLENAFDIETVSDEFFLEYRRLFIEAKKALDHALLAEPDLKSEFDAKQVNSVDFAKKLLGQIVFLYYLQKKGWFGVPKKGKWGEGSKNFLRELFEKKHGDYKNFFNDILEPLFYEALRRDRSDVDHYYSRFDCKIPFLNGGLFDPIGDYDWVNSDLVLPDSLFANKQKTGILDVFDRYNFTVREDEPFEKEVAIDPELLGKAYEKFNAIRPDNFDEYLQALKDGKRGSESKFNKKFGVYYTPREIVHYMCQQSLIQYLDTALNEKRSYQELGSSQQDMFGNTVTRGQLRMTESQSWNEIPKKDIETLILHGEQIKEHEARVVAAGRETATYSFELPESIRANAARVDEALASVKVCDPAVGSGAFPVGMMNEIVKAREVLSTYIKSPLPEEKGTGGRASTYAFKRACIENSLYGVDIDPGAVEIAKLRLWLSLIVDEEDPHNIKPLPNLDYKIMAGNSLLGLPKGVLLNPQILEKLEKRKKEYFDETHPAKKKEAREEINALFAQLIESASQFDSSLGEINFDFDTHFSEVKHGKGGFDVIIGNPPYIQLQKDGGALADLYQKSGYDTFSRMGDIYTLFYEKAIRILHDGGHLTFITSNKWMRAGYGKKLRGFLLKQANIKRLIDFGDAPLFKNATTYTNILIAAKGKQQTTPQVLDLSAKPDLMENLTAYLHSSTKKYQAVFGEKSFLIVNRAEYAIKKKVEKAGIPLKNWDINIYRGIVTGYNDAFIIDGAKRAELIAADPKAAEIIKPVLRGRDIKRYAIDRRDEWVIFIPWHFPFQGDKNIQGVSEKAEKEFLEQYPSIYKHLLSHRKRLSSRNKSETGIRYEWYALQRWGSKYHQEFEKEKIIWGNLATAPSYALDDEKTYINAPSNLLTSDTENLKYLLALLNSKLLFFIFENIAYSRGSKFYEFKKVFVEQLPIVRPPIEIERKLESLVLDIQGMKKSNPDADTRALEAKIDALVYELYGLTEEEIAVVEGRA